MDAQTKQRVINLATAMIAGQIAKGELRQSNEAIQAAMPQAIADAKAAVAAAEEFVCG